MAASPAKYFIRATALIWVASQVCFFWPPRDSAYLLPSREGNFLIFQNSRKALIVGAFADKRGLFAKRELIPFLKRRGVIEIDSLILTGHGSEKTGAWHELQKSFEIREIWYFSAAAAEMRKTFKGRIGQARFRRLDPKLEIVFGSWSIKFCDSAEKKSIAASFRDLRLNYDFAADGKTLGGPFRKMDNDWFSAGSICAECLPADDNGFFRAEIPRLPIDSARARG